MISCWRKDFLVDSTSMKPEEYKAGRNDEYKYITNQVCDIVYLICIQMNYLVLKSYLLEADDLIALYIKENHEGNTFVLISNDDDFTQLKKYNTWIWNPNVTKWNGKEPISSLIIKLFIGDESDNISRIFETVYCGKDKEPIVVQFGKDTIPKILKKYLKEKSIEILPVNDKFEEETELDKTLKNNYLNEMFSIRDELVEMLFDNYIQKILAKYLKDLRIYLKVDSEIIAMELKPRELTKYINENWTNHFLKDNKLKKETSDENIDDETFIINSLKRTLEKNLSLNTTLIDFDYVPQNILDIYHGLNFENNNYSLQELEKTFKLYKLDNLTNLLKN